MTHAYSHYDEKGLGISVEEALKRGWDVELWRINDSQDPETVKNENRRKAMISAAMKVWKEHAEKWRICRMEYLFYLTMKKTLKIPTRSELRQGAVIRGFRFDPLLEKLNEIDAYGYLCSLSDDKLSSECNFVQNWVQYDYAYTSLKSWSYDFRMILNNSKIDKNYKGDIFDRTSDYQKPGKKHSFWKPVQPVVFRYSAKTEYGRSAAVY